MNSTFVDKDEQKSFLNTYDDKCISEVKDTITKGIFSHKEGVAVWLIENTILTFKQIADACGFHELQIKAIADGELANGTVGVDPIMTGELTKEEIDRCVADHHARLRPMLDHMYDRKRKKKKVSYTPVARRRAKPDAIFWLIKNYPGFTNAHIIKLIGTTSKVIDSIRNNVYWNMENIKPRDPVLLKLCTQEALDEIATKVVIAKESEDRFDKIQSNLS